MAKDKREELVEFLDRKVFDPVLSTSSDKFEGKQKDMFQDVKRSTESEKRRFHESYRSAEEVRSNYLSDLDSKAAKKKDAELSALGLPKLPDFKNEFLGLCDRLGVGPRK